jgi:hypothetical protein
MGSVFIEASRLRTAIDPAMQARDGSSGLLPGAADELRQSRIAKSQCKS